MPIILIPLLIVACCLIIQRFTVCVVKPNNFTCILGGTAAIVMLAAGTWFSIELIKILP